jgi:hypothetical protein
MAKSQKRRSYKKKILGGLDGDNTQQKEDVVVGEPENASEAIDINDMSKKGEVLLEIAQKYSKGVAINTASQLINLISSNPDTELCKKIWKLRMKIRENVVANFSDSPNMKHIILSTFRLNRARSANESDETYEKRNSDYDEGYVNYEDKIVVDCTLSKNAYYSFKEIAEIASLIKGKVQTSKTGDYILLKIDTNKEKYYVADKVNKLTNPIKAIKQYIGETFHYYKIPTVLIFPDEIIKEINELATEVEEYIQNSSFKDVPDKEAPPSALGGKRTRKGKKSTKKTRKQK